MLKMLKISNKVRNAGLLTILCIIFSCFSDNIFLAFLQLTLYIQIIRLLVQRSMEE